MNLEKVANSSKKYRKRIEDRQKIIKNRLGVNLHSLILPLRVQSNEKAIKLQEALKVYGFLVGAIRQPTVEKPILRVIPSALGSSNKVITSHY